MADDWRSELAALKERVAYLEGRLETRWRTGPPIKGDMVKLREMALVNLRQQLSRWFQANLITAEQNADIYEYERRKYE